MGKAILTQCLDSILQDDWLTQVEHLALQSWSSLSLSRVFFTACTDRGGWCPSTVGTCWPTSPGSLGLGGDHKNLLLSFRKCISPNLSSGLGVAGSKNGRVGRLSNHFMLPVTRFPFPESSAGAVQNLFCLHCNSPTSIKIQSAVWEALPWHTSQARQTTIS